MSLPRFSPLASHLQRAQGLVTSPFNYILPPSTIAAYPLPDRASSKLLVVPRHSSPTHHRFSDLPTLIPSNSLLVLNSSKVIPTRIPAQKCTGGKAEVFLLEPLSDLPQHALESPAHGQMWRAIIGGKRIKKGDTLTSSANSDLNVRIVEKENNSATVCFNAPSDHSLSSLLNAIGEPPLPPYLKRPAESEDTVNYQTVYAREQGSVAAPTAGLHMTERLMNQLCERGVKTIQVVLHVGAGTFRQLESQVAGAHQMHGENILVQGRQIETLLSHIRAKRPVVAVVRASSLLLVFDAL